MYILNPCLLNLSAQELALAANADIMLTKNKIIGEVYELFGKLAESYQCICGHLPPALTAIHPKIAKGENYLGLPWVMLDFPRNFSAQDTFAIRTLFWWGNHFSLHLLLQGKYMHQLNKELLLKGNYKDWFFCTGTNPWQHHFDESYMLPVDQLTKAVLNEQPFYKLSIKMPITNWVETLPFMKKKIAEVLQLL